MKFPEIEISLRQRVVDGYEAELRFRDPAQEVEQQSTAYPLRFEFEQLRELAYEPTEYGRLLGRNLLGHPDVRSCYDKVRTLAQLKNQPLRLRLSLDRSALELHGLRWETLRDPQTDRSLLTDEGILFSRFLGSFDMRPVQLRAKSQLRALVAIANPSDLDQRKPGGRTLAPIDATGELERARASLEGVEITELVGAERVTLDKMLDCLRDDYDVLYLVCHGALIENEPRLWLEDENGESKVTAGPAMVEGLSRLARLPRLVVLASCQSAGIGEDSRSDDDGVLSALGPSLAEAGIPAVVAMQGNVLQRTITKFMPVFFRELLNDGQIDRAMLEARFAVREHPDNWSPVLYTRLVTGRLWYEQRFAKSNADFEIWDGLLDQIRDGNLVPVLGTGLLEPYVGPIRNFARTWAEKRDFPLAGVTQTDLHRVAQYVATTQGKAFAINDFVREAIEHIRRLWPALEPSGAASSNGQGAHVELLRLISTVRQHRLRDGKLEAYQVLSSLSCPLFLTANPDDLLADALRTEGKTPHEKRSIWQSEYAAQRKQTDELPSPTVEHPRIVQMFGHFMDKKSLVLTEDDYFDYLIGASRYYARPRPSALLEKLTDAGLMFLGFRIDDWDFRVLIHLLQSLQGSKLRGFYKNVAVQVDPEEGRGADLDRVRAYLEKYFGAPAMQIEIYWGSAEDFLSELSQRWQQSN